MSRPHRSLTVVASLPVYCPVCGDDRRVVSLFPGTVEGVERDCPHCSPRIGSPIPIYVYEPYQGDLPNGAA